MGQLPCTWICLHKNNPPEVSAHLRPGSGPATDGFQIIHDFLEDPVDVMLPVEILLVLLALVIQSESGIFILNGKVLIIC